MTGVNIGGRAVVLPTGTVPYIGTYFDAPSGFNFNYVGMFMGPQEMSGPMTTPTASFVEEPALSPDGTLVAFIEAGTLWTIKPNGTDLQHIYAGTDPDYEGTVQGFQWAPDSTHILFAVWFGAFPTQNKIFTVPRDGGGITTLYTHSTSSSTGNPRYNSDQSKILFCVVSSASVSQIWVMDADGTGATMLDTMPTQFSSPRNGWWEGDSLDRFIWNDGTLASPVWKSKTLAGASVVTLASGGNNTPRRNNETFNPDGLGYLVWTTATPTDVNSIAFDGSGSTDFVTMGAFFIGGNLFITPPSRFDNRMWMDAGNQIWSAPLSDLTDQRDETVNGDGVGTNFGLSG